MGRERGWRRAEGKGEVQGLGGDWSRGLLGFSPCLPCPQNQRRGRERLAASDTGTLTYLGPYVIDSARCEGCEGRNYRIQRTAVKLAEKLPCSNPIERLRIKRARGRSEEPGLLATFIGGINHFCR